MTRTFEDVEARLDKVPLLVGLMGPSGGGKTLSALRLAAGIQRVSGGDIYVIDTEAGRAKHYANDFKFRHVRFDAPFCPLDYLAAIEHCVKRGAGAVIVDSMSHEHEGPGGVLEQHEAEMHRLAAASRYPGSIETHNFPAWAAPKAKRRRLINTVVQLGVSSIFCFRAKEKSKPVKRGDVVDGKVQEKGGMLDLGWMPIAGEEFVFEMGCNLLLDSCSDGRPTIKTDDVGTRRMLKVPRAFRDIIKEGVQLSEDIGEQMARWASGQTGVKTAAKPATAQKPRGDIEDALTRMSNAPAEDVPHLANELREFQWTPQEGQRIKSKLAERTAREPGEEG